MSLWCEVRSLSVPYSSVTLRMTFPLKVMGNVDEMAVHRGVKSIPVVLTHLFAQGISASGCIWQFRIKGGVVPCK